MMSGRQASSYNYDNGVLTSYGGNTPEETPGGQSGNLPAGSSSLQTSPPPETPPLSTQSTPSITDSPTQPIIGTPHILGTDPATGEFLVWSYSDVLLDPNDNRNLDVGSDVGGAQITLGDGNNSISTVGDGNVVATGGMLSQVYNQGGTGNVTFFNADHPVTWDAVTLHAGDSVAVIGDAPGTVFWTDIAGSGAFSGLTREDFTPTGQAHFTTFSGINASNPQAAGLVSAWGTDPSNGNPFAVIAHS